MVDLKDKYFGKNDVGSQTLLGYDEETYECNNFKADYRQTIKLMVLDILARNNVITCDQAALQSELQARTPDLRTRYIAKDYDNAIEEVGIEELPPAQKTDRELKLEIRDQIRGEELLLRALEMMTMLRPSRARALERIAYGEIGVAPFRFDSQVQQMQPEPEIDTVGDESERPHFAEEEVIPQQENVAVEPVDGEVLPEGILEVDGNQTQPVPEVLSQDSRIFQLAHTYMPRDIMPIRFFMTPLGMLVVAMPSISRAEMEERRRSNSEEHDPEQGRR